MMMRLVLSLLVTCLMLVASAGRSFAAVTITPLRPFDVGGWQPLGALVDGGDGYLYGTTQFGGSGVPSPAGTVFRITTAGSFSTLYTFDFQVTGDQPFAGVLRLADGTLFGTTRGSGSFNGNVFRFGAPVGFSNLHSFTGYFVGGDAGHPQATLVEGGDGNLYGTTMDGGASNVGTLYKIDAGGGYSIVHSFRGGLAPEQDGAYPLGGLVLGDDGALYGTTSVGGPTQPSSSFGTVFRYTPGTIGVTTLHAFKGSDGEGPNATLVKALDGQLYGTTGSGGAHSAGTAFRIRESGTGFESLHDFSFAESYSPTGLTAGNDGNLYGTTTSGGANFLGTVFRLRPDGDFQTLASFSFPSDAGHGPKAPLVQADDGDFYGTTSAGGGGGKGTVFKIAGADILVPEPAAALSSAAAGLALSLVTGARSRRPRHSMR